MAQSQIMSAEEIFDKIGLTYEEAYSGLAIQLGSLQWALSQIQHLRPAKILDLGCGTGRPVCSTFAEAGHDVLGVDISGAMLRAAQANVPHAKFTKADVFHMDLSPDTYDVITIFFSMAMDSSQDLIRAQIARIYQWLKRDGILVLATVASDRDQEIDSFMGHTCLLSNLSSSDYLARLEDVGFEIIHQSTSKFTPQAVRKSNKLEAGDVREEVQWLVHARKK